MTPFLIGGKAVGRTADRDQIRTCNALTRWVSVAHVAIHGELENACALSMLRRLTMVGWATTHRADALPKDLWIENQPGTVDIAARFLASPLWLVDGR